jgi:ADP-heptose:LPS heptosyltransferase
MKASRAPTRARALAGALLHTLRPTRRARAERPASVLVLHDLLLGDTLMLAALLAALRARYPLARLFVTAPPALLPLFHGRPYGAEALAFDERAPGAMARLAPARNCDIAFIPGENRHAALARALGARWVVSFAGARPGWKNWLADELVPFPERPAALGEIFASLAGPHTAPRYRPEDWPRPPCRPFSPPASPYAVLHVGARSPLRRWMAERWRELAERLSAKGYSVVWTAGPGEEALVRDIDPGQRHRSYAGELDLAQVWNLVARAALLVSLDTGVAHLGKLTGTPTVCLFGPGDAALLGKGDFWSEAPFFAVTVPAFPCRDQALLFKRPVHWVRHCARTPAQCDRARCMEALTVEDVMAALPE